MSKEAEKVILDTIRQRKGSVSMVELQRALRDAGIPADGDRTVEPLENMVLWVSMSTEFAAAVVSLLNSKKIKPRVTSVLVYAFDGMLLSLPLARRRMKYKTPHWVPVVFDAVQP